MNKKILGILSFSLILVGILFTLLFWFGNLVGYSRAETVFNNKFDLSKKIIGADACTHGCIKGNPTRTIINCAEFCSDYYLNMSIDEWIKRSREDVK